jgi:antitoxin (DNA-binding transcriptional repressor) of toxin-antitoxin stability system
VPTYPLRFAKAHLPELVARAEAGEEVVLAHGEKRPRCAWPRFRASSRVGVRAG